MTDLVIDVRVTRAELGLPDLVRSEASAAQVVAWDPGDVSKRRTVAKSPTIAGGQQTSSVADMRVGRLVLRIFGLSKSTLDAHVQTWINAFEQTSYNLTVSINGVDTTWECDDAEYGLVSETGGIDKFRLMATPMRQLYEFRIPMQPYPTEGVL